MKKFKRILSLVLVLVLAFALCACGKSESKAEDTTPADKTEQADNTTPADGSSESKDDTAAPESQTADESGEPAYGGVFGIGKAMRCFGLCNIYKFNYAEQYNFPAIEALARWNFETQEYDPWLLDSWEHDYDACTLTMNIHPGILFHDGTPFDAEALKWNIDTFIANRTGATLNNPTSIDVTGDYQVTVHFSEPSFAWESNFAGLQMYSPTAYSAHDEDWAQVNAVGTGPFVLESYAADSLIKYVKNDHYWVEGLPYLDEYDVHIILDWAANEAAFIEGYDNYSNVPEASTCKEMIALGYESVTADVPENYMEFYVGVNNTIPDDPFYKKEVRDAVLNYAIDWTGIAMSRDDGRGVVAYCGQLTTPGAWGYLDDFAGDVDTYDQDKAKEMLAAAGYPNGFDTKIYAMSAYTVMATQIQSELKKIGINAEVVNADTLNSQYDASLAGMHMGAWVNKTDNANTVAQTFYPGYWAVIDYTPEYIAAVDKAQSALTKEDRIAATEEAMRMLYEDMCVIKPYFSQKNYTVLTEGAHNTGAEYKTYFHEAVYWDADHIADHQVK